MRPFWKLYLKIFGWKIIGMPPSLDKFVIIVGPHTSYLDFILGVAVRSVMQMRTHYLGKKELFQPPFGFIFKMLGGYPVDRSSSKNMVDEVKVFDAHEKFSIALAPEGTRKKVEKLRTGFYHIALKAKVPLAMAALDFGNKEVIFSDPFELTGNKQEDFERIFAFFRNVKGKYPELGMHNLKIE
jgi:1-acyl-sn-glycerol-3-phosphate acyltransferase